jgi:hypothetical protein
MDARRQVSAQSAHRVLSLVRTGAEELAGKESERRGRWSAAGKTPKRRKPKAPARERSRGLGPAENAPAVVVREDPEMLEVQPMERQFGAPDEKGCRFLAVGEAGAGADPAPAEPVLPATVGAVPLKA